MYGGSVSLRARLRRTQRLRDVARGYKAGGFNIGAQVPRTSAASWPRACTTSSSACASTRRRHAAGDLALFYMRRYDQQVPTGEQLVPGDPLSFVLYTDNAARGENYGLEGTLRWRPPPHYCRPARRAARDAYHRLRLQRPRPRRARAGARAAIQYDLGVEYSHARGCFARVDFAGSTTSTSTSRTMNVHRRAS
jgi:hypothetical protein